MDRRVLSGDIPGLSRNACLVCVDALLLIISLRLSLSFAPHGDTVAEPYLLLSTVELGATRPRNPLRRVPHLPPIAWK